jgi:4-amino-4-deoxy-L-arabinose transferase-like glycosyltransferase
LEIGRVAGLARIWAQLAVAGILALALALRGWSLGDRGFITPYYMAGVRSMMTSWHNFFFNAFDPSGFVSLDKPPFAFWLQTASAKLFGFGPFSVLLPQALEGAASILVLYCLVRRAFGAAAGLLAALFLVLTPIAVAADRSNNTDSALVLMLLLAAWALSWAVETGRGRYLLLSAALVGLGFNVKMLVAFGVVPVFALLYISGAPIPVRRRIGHLAAAGVVLAAVSLSWAAVYDLTPPRSRPFVDSSHDNSMLELVVGHNGIQRFVRPVRVPQAAAPVDTAPSTGLPPVRDHAPAGPLRLAAPHLAAQVGWLFPLAVIGGIAAWSRTRPLRVLGRGHLSLALWAGWAFLLRHRVQCRRRFFPRLLLGRRGAGIGGAGRDRGGGPVVVLHHRRSGCVAASHSPHRHRAVAGLYRRRVSHRLSRDR